MTQGDLPSFMIRAQILYICQHPAHSDASSLVFSSWQKCPYALDLQEAWWDLPTTSDTWPMKEPSGNPKCNLRNRLNFASTNVTAPLLRWVDYPSSRVSVCVSIPSYNLAFFFSLLLFLWFFFFSFFFGFSFSSFILESSNMSKASSFVREYKLVMVGGGGKCWWMSLGKKIILVHLEPECKKSAWT